MTDTINLEKKCKKKELESMQAEIAEELENIKQIKKSLQKLTKTNKKDKKQQRISLVEDNEIVKFKNDAQYKIVKEDDYDISSKFSMEKKTKMNHPSNASILHPKQYKTVFTLDASLDLVSYARKNTADGTSFSIFTKDLIDYLNLDCNSSFDYMIEALQRIIADDTILLNPVFKKLSKNRLTEYIEILSESKGLTSLYKEKLTELFLLLSAFTYSGPANHPSIRKVKDYLSEDNLVCGINHAKSVQGFDQMIIKVEQGLGFRKLEIVNPIEFKYRYKNHLSWQVPSQTYNPKIFEMSIQQILETRERIGAYLIDKSGFQIYDPKSSFGRFLAETRGNAAIIKMAQWNLQLNVIAEQWTKLPQNAGLLYPLHEIVPNSGGKSLQKCLELVLYEQFRLEALAESEFIINYKGNLQGRYSNHPILKKTFEFIAQGVIKKREILGGDFRVDDKTAKGSEVVVFHPDFVDGLEIREYITFPLIEDNNFMSFLDFNPTKYRIYISNQVDDIITSDNEIIVCSTEFYKNFKQYLCGEIKTRFVNDIRDNLRLLGWNGIVSDDFEFQHDVSFITSTPTPKDYFDKFSGAYRFHDNLHKLKAEHHILGVDYVNCYALRPNADVNKHVTSNWFVNLSTNFHKERIPLSSVKIEKDIEDPFLDLTETYGLNIPNPEWEGYGMLTVNTYLCSGEYGVKTVYLEKLETESADLMKDLPKEYAHETILQRYDIFTESKNLFSRESIYTTRDYTKSISKISKRKVTNEIRAEYLTRQSFDGISDETELLVTLIRKDGKNKRFVRDGTDLLIMDSSIMVHRDQINYFPLVRKYSNKSTGSSRYRFEIHTSNPDVLQSLKNNLLECPWISDRGYKGVEINFSGWMNRLSNRNTNSHKSDQTIQVSFNAFETLWLLIYTARSMNELETELFLDFLNHYNLLIASGQHKKASLLWPSESEELSLCNFRKIYSFGLMGSSMQRYKHRIIYEVKSNEFMNFLDLIYKKCMQLLMYSGKKPYLKWVRNFMQELGNILY
ncbi:MAG: hypothetical protein GOP50_11715 [Candidatus Heimdallarchaeota archaeon]|nr:hypothetical protein [Candidatus Heimdallarchaeota archaeon]